MTAVEASVSVHVALARVAAELPAIGKDAKASQQQGGYAYRGIEAITRHVQSLFASHGVVVVPRVRSIETRDLLVNSKPWTDTTLVVDYTLVGPDGSTLEATTVGIGRDNADKGANKAMTQAFKYLLLQVLCISDAKDDADGTTFEADAPPAPHPLHDRVEQALADMKALTDSDKAELKAWADGRKLSGAALLANEGFLTHLEDWLAERAGDRGDSSHTSRPAWRCERSACHCRSRGALRASTRRKSNDTCPERWHAHEQRAKPEDTDA